MQFRKGVFHSARDLIVSVLFIHCVPRRVFLTLINIDFLLLIYEPVCDW